MEKTSQTYQESALVKPDAEKFEALRESLGLTQEQVWSLAYQRKAEYKAKFKKPEKEKDDETVANPKQFERFLGTASGCTGNVTFETVKFFVNALQELCNSLSQQVLAIYLREAPSDEIKQIIKRISRRETLGPEEFVLGLAPKGKKKPSDRVEADSIPSSKDFKETGEQGKRDEPSVSVIVSGIWRKRTTTLAIGVLASVTLCAGIAAFLLLPGSGNQIVVAPSIESGVGAVVVPVSLRDARAPLVESPLDNAVEPMDDYALLAGRGIRYWQTGDYDKAALALNEALRLRGKDVQILILYAESTRLSPGKDDFASRVQDALERLDMRRASLNEDDPWLVHLEMAQGKALAALGKNDESVKIINSAIRHLNSPGVTSSERITYYLDIADVFQLNGNAGAAKKYIAKARDLAALVPSDEWAGYWCEAYLAWMDRENRQQADGPIKAAIEWSEKQLLPNDRTIAQLYAFYADALELRGRIQDAKGAIELALKWAREEASDERAESIWRFQLARILIYEGQSVIAIASNKAANKELDAAIAWQQSQLPIDERTVAIMKACYATSFLNTSEYSSALTKIDEAIRWGESSDQSDLLEAWYRTKAAIYRWMAKPTPDAKLDQESLDKAIAEYKKSFAIVDKTNHYRIYQSLMLSAKLHELNNEKSLALDDLNAAEAEVRNREIPGGNATPLQMIQARRKELGEMR